MFMTIIGLSVKCISKIVFFFVVRCVLKLSSSCSFLLLVCSKMRGMFGVA